MKKPTKDLFDDSTMTFGEHLEALRKHLILALLGLTVSVVICLYQGELIVDFVRSPIDRALRAYAEPDRPKKEGWEGWKESLGFTYVYEFYAGIMDYFQGRHPVDIPESDPTPPLRSADSVVVQIDKDQLVKVLQQVDPGLIARPVESSNASSEPSQTSSPSDAPKAAGSSAATPVEPVMVTLTLVAPEFAQFQATVEQSRRPVTLNVQEAFMMYLKVSIIAGILLASPWIFYQLWLFVAAGLYQHERKYVYIYGSMSLALFIIGALFCFLAVFPFVLNFLLQFNKSLQIQPQIRLSEWISFASILPIMFGISFQLPLVMLFLDRISIFNVDTYREQRRMAILVIAILSAILTPADPVSMLLMLIPMVFLYELGIRLCVWMPRHGDELESAV